MEFTIKEYNEYHEQEILNLYKSVGWVNYVNHPEMLKNAYESSLKILGAYNGEKLLGIIRVVGDGYSIIYIQDIIVLPEYQHQGIGTALINKMTEIYKNVYQKVLLTDDTDKTIQFYQSVSGISGRYGTGMQGFCEDGITKIERICDVLRERRIKNKDYRRLLMAIIVSEFGDVLFDLFIVWKITMDSQNIMNAAYMLGSSIAFRGILSLGIGIIIDKYNKKKLIIGSNILSALIIATFAVAYPFVIGHIMVGIAFILVNDICNAVFWNTYTVIASEKFPREEFITFQSNSAMCTRCVNIVGSAIVGAVIYSVPDIYIFGIDILTFLVSSVLVAKVDYQYGVDQNKKLRLKFREDILCGMRNAFLFILQTPIVKSIVVLIFGLNLAYGFIPNILPLAIAENSGNAMVLGWIKSAMALGEVLGLIVVNHYGKYISTLFKISMLSCGICMLSLLVLDNYLLVVVFLVYGMFDAMTQPMFSYMIMNIDEEERGKILGGIDTILLLSPSIGIAIGTKLIAVDYSLAVFYLAVVFGAGLLMVVFNKNINCVRM